MKNIKSEYIKLVCGTNEPFLLIKRSQDLLKENITKNKEVQEQKLKNMLKKLTF